MTADKPITWEEKYHELVKQFELAQNVIMGLNSLTQRQEERIIALSDSCASEGQCTCKCENVDSGAN